VSVLEEVAQLILLFNVFMRKYRREQDPYAAWIDLGGES
jgi:hypothetical protein